MVKMVTMMTMSPCTTLGGEREQSACGQRESLHVVTPLASSIIIIVIIMTVMMMTIVILKILYK